MSPIHGYLKKVIPAGNYPRPLLNWAFSTKGASGRFGIATGGTPLLQYYYIAGPLFCCGYRCRKTSPTATDDGDIGLKIFNRRAYVISRNIKSSFQSIHQLRHYVCQMPSEYDYMVLAKLRQHVLPRGSAILSEKIGFCKACKGLIKEEISHETKR